MGEITIQFRGLSTHFLNQPIGKDGALVKHRVVLSNAAAARYGVVRINGIENDVAYALCPHVPAIALRQGDWTKLPSIAGAIESGVIYAGIHLQILNPAERELEYCDDFGSRVPHLEHFVPQCNVAPGVVAGVNARCHFDLTAGKVDLTPEGDPAVHAIVTVETEGEPILRVTPFYCRDQDPSYTDLTLPSGSELFIANVGMSCGEEASSLDFMLHYLSSAQGVPQVMTKRPYGYDGGVTSIDHVRHTQSLAALLATGWPDPARMQIAPVKAMMGTAASCSDAQYP
jgi:hypothetical protein